MEVEATETYCPVVQKLRVHTDALLEVQDLAGISEKGICLASPHQASLGLHMGFLVFIVMENGKISQIISRVPHDHTKGQSIA